MGVPCGVFQVDRDEQGVRLGELETYAYDAALAKSKGNVSAAARLLGVTSAQLDSRLAKRQGTHSEAGS